MEERQGGCEEAIQEPLWIHAPIPTGVANKEGHGSQKKFVGPKGRIAKHSYRKRFVEQHSVIL